MKITVKELLDQHGITWFGLYKRSRGAISKSMSFDWARGAHQPTRRSALKIAFALGIKPADLLARLETREKSDNYPPQPAFCLYCHRRMYKVPKNGEGYLQTEVQ